MLGVTEPLTPEKDNLVPKECGLDLRKSLVRQIGDRYTANFRAHCRGERLYLDELGRQRAIVELAGRVEAHAGNTDRGGRWCRERPACTLCASLYLVTNGETGVQVHRAVNSNSNATSEQA